VKFIKIDSGFIEQNKKSIDNFFERNKDDYQFFHPHAFSSDGLLSEISNKPLDYFVFLIESGDILGYGMLRGKSEGYEVPSLGIIIDINFRGIGISGLLMNHLHEIAKDYGSSKIRLSVYKENKKAISLYSKLGYNFAEKNKDELIGIKEF